MDKNSNETTGTSVSEFVQGIDREVLVWGVISFLFAIFSIVVNTAPIVTRAGFFAKIFAILVGSALGLGGALIGNALRKFAQPDAVYTTGGFFRLIWTKVFWKIGPQVIGLLIGVIFGIAIVLK